jgi:hypothetical protein
MQKIQGTIHIPERQQSEQNVDEPLKRLNETDSKGKKNSTCRGMTTPTALY